MENCKEKIIPTVYKKAVSIFEIVAYFGLTARCFKELRIILQERMKVDMLLE